MSTPQAELSGADDVNKREGREGDLEEELPGRKLDFWVSLPSLLSLTSSAPESSACGVDSALNND